MPALRWLAVAVGGLGLRTGLFRSGPCSAQVRAPSRFRAPGTTSGRRIEGATAWCPGA
jgi:hypothetical protein